MASLEVRLFRHIEGKYQLDSAVRPQADINREFDAIVLSNIHSVNTPT